MPHSVPPPAPPPIVQVVSPEAASKAFVIAHQPVIESHPIQDTLRVERIHIPESIHLADATEPSPAASTPTPRPRYQRPGAGDVAQAIAPTTPLTEAADSAIPAATSPARPRYQRPDRVDADEAIAPEAAVLEPAAIAPPTASSPVPRYHRQDRAGNTQAIAPEATAAVESSPARSQASIPAPSRSRAIFRRRVTSAPIPPLFSEPTTPADTTAAPVGELAPAPRRRPVFRRPTSTPIPPLFSEQAAAVHRNRAADLGPPIGISLQDVFSQPPPAEFSAGVTPTSPALQQPSLGEEQRVSLQGSTSLLPMLSELQQLSGATVVAQSRQDPADRVILSIPENDMPGSAESGIQDELVVPPADSVEPESRDSEISPSDSPATDSESRDSILLPGSAETGIPENQTLPSPSLPTTETLTGESTSSKFPNGAAVGTSPEGLPQDAGEVVILNQADVLELDADYLEYDTLRDIFFAEGNVEMRFRQAVLTADRMRINTQNRQAVAEGNVVFTRGEQILLGDRLDYNIVQGAGSVTGVRGELYLPTSGEDLTVLPTDVGAESRPSRPIGGTLNQGGNDSPVQSDGGIQVGVGAGGNSNAASGALLGGEIRRFRFEAESAEFYPNGWQATNVRLTNDPFSPPELELRSPFVTYTRLSPLRAEVRARNPVVVFDQNFRLPLFQNRILIDNRRRDNTPLAQIGYEDNLGGLFLQRPISLISSDRVAFSISPLLLVQRAVEDNGFNFLAPSSLGAIFRFNYDIAPQTTLTWRAVLESFELNDFENQFRSNLRLTQAIGTHQLSLEYAHRNRFFNGSLGFQEVDRSIGFVLTSPVIPLGTSGLSLSYQAGAQFITADTDRRDLLDPGERVAPVDLFRAQGSVALNRVFTLWQGTPLPRTRDEGMRFTPAPVVPFLRIIGGVRGVVSAYSSDDIQSTLTASVSLRGQVGHFSRNTFDYTGFNITLSETMGDGESPFRFDRAVDRSVLSFGFLQQIYGPIRFGVQTSINLDTSNTIDTVYTLEYSRRTYSITLRYSPIRESGSLSLQINDFDWNNLRDPFSGPTGAATVESGVQLSND